MKIPPLQNKLVGVSFTNGFSDPKSFRDFRESGPRVENQQTRPTYDAECGNQTRKENYVTRNTPTHRLLVMTIFTEK